MTFLSRLFGHRDDSRTNLHPLWNRIVAVARDRDWYVRLGIADTVSGRFDAVTLVLALVMLRMEREPELIEPSARLTELFVADMDGQLRQSGIGDLVVGKHVGKLMSVLGGRIAALREANDSGGSALAATVERNVTMVPGADALKLAEAVSALASTIDKLDASQLLSGDFTK